MLGEFLLPAFTCLGHECQDLWSPCDGTHMCTDLTLAYTLIRQSFWGTESEPMLTPRGKHPLLEAQKRIEPMILHEVGKRAEHTTN